MLGNGMGATCWLDGDWGFLTPVRFGRVPDTYQGSVDLTLLGCWAGWIDRWVIGGALGKGCERAAVSVVATIAT